MAMQDLPRGRKLDCPACEAPIIIGGLDHTGASIWLDAVSRIAHRCPEPTASRHADHPAEHRRDDQRDRHPDQDDEERARARWPELARPAYHGLAGDFVETTAPTTEAGDAALLAQFLTAFGNAVGRDPHTRVEADRHGLNLFMALVGETASARKGTSWGRVRAQFDVVQAEWVRERIDEGLSSGEGLIWAVRDPITKEEPIKEKGIVVGYQTVETDPGITDKRLLVMQGEFAQVLRVMTREGNTLSTIIRRAWETGDLHSMTKNTPAQSTGAHISMIGHITRDELMRSFADVEAANGFGNRFLWFVTKRARVLPEGASLSPERMQPITTRLQQAVTFAATVGEVSRDADARAAWYTVYPKLSDPGPGLIGALLARGAAQVMRLSAIYALLDLSSVVRMEHLKAALAVWEYSEASVRWIFGDKLGDPDADEILRVLRLDPEGLTRSEIRDHFGRHRSAAQLSRALGVLHEHQLADRTSVETGGRPAEVWRARNTN